MRSYGTYISGIGHVGLVGWLILGWGFNAEPLPFEVSEVSVVSSEEFAAIVAATTPQPDVAEPTAPVVPVIDDTPPPARLDTPPAAVEPPPTVPAPDQETPPPAPPEPPTSPADVADTAPVEPTPPAVEPTPALTQPTRPLPRPAPRIAPEAVAPPPPDADIADVLQDAVVPDESAVADMVEPAQEATAPEEAATEIVTEAEEPSGAVASSVRPAARPNRPAPAQQTAQEDDNAVAEALAAALAGEAVEPDLPAGPPLTGSEREGFRVAVNRCWNVDPGSQAARVTVTVAFELDQSGRVQGDVRQVAATGGDASATGIAFQAARRAILRCGASGYDLPVDKYDQWRAVEITFDPSGMRLR